MLRQLEAPGHLPEGQVSKKVNVHGSSVRCSSVWIIFYAPVVGVKTCFFALWQGGGVGMSAVVCNQSNIEMLSQNRG